MIARCISRCVLPALAAGAAFLASASAASAQTAVETGGSATGSCTRAPAAAARSALRPRCRRAKEPATANRAKIVLYISAWPKEGVKSEISIKMGYPVKTGSTVAVTVGSDAFDLFGKDDRAFVADPTEELKLIEAMKKGSKLTVQGSSEKGTVTDRHVLAQRTRSGDAGPRGRVSLSPKWTMIRFDCRVRTSWSRRACGAGCKARLRRRAGWRRPRNSRRWRAAPARRATWAHCASRHPRSFAPPKSCRSDRHFDVAGRLCR